MTMKAMIRMSVTSRDNHGNVAVVIHDISSSNCCSLELMMRIGHATGTSNNNSNSNDSNVNAQDDFWWATSHHRRTVEELVLPNS